jgi:cysteine-rich repeat protein
MMGMMRACVLLALLAACIESNEVTCADGTVCRSGTRCVAVAGQDWCATPDQFATCAGAADGTACSYVGGLGLCESGVCLPYTPQCGNGIVDPGEACDDGNHVDGDGCSADCTSDETCGNGITDQATHEQCDDHNLESHDGCSSRCRFESPHWTPIHARPTPRMHAAITYDATRDRVVMFGGLSFDDNNNPVAVGDTWQWNGNGWNQRGLDYGPPPRVSAQMVYDAAVRAVVLFGGADAQIKGAFDDTWLWDGTSWSYLVGAGPSPRVGHAMAYDAVRGRVVLFGGYNPQLLLGNGFGDTWQWTSAGWTQICGDPMTLCGPPARAYPAIAFDPTRGVVVMFGGRAGSQYLSDVWELDATGWHSIMTAGGPLPRAYGQMMFDSGLRQVVLTGGSDGTATPFNDTWTWDGHQWSPIAGASTHIWGHAIAALPTQNTAVSFGGANAYPATLPFKIGTRSWAGSEWGSQQPLNVPILTGHRGAYDPISGGALVFGGGDGTSLALGDSVFDGEAWVATLAAPPAPPARSQLAMAYDATDHQAVVFGGQDGTTKLLDDTWLGTSAGFNQAQPAAKPSPRQGHAMATATTHVLLFGGYDGMTNLADTWQWSGSTWMQRATGAEQGAPAARVGHVLGYDPVRDRVVMFGGTTGTVDFGDTWEWDGSKWTQIVPPGSPPEPRANAAFGWDPARRRLVLFGGSRHIGTAGMAYLSDAWEYDGTTWSLLPLTNHPEARDGAAMLPARHGVLVSGGSQIVQGVTTVFQSYGGGELWRLRWDDSDPDEVCTQFDGDGDGAIGCADPDCAAICSACGDGYCYPGSGSCRVCPQDCPPNVCLVVCGDLQCDPGETHATCPGDCP